MGIGPWTDVQYSEMLFSVMLDDAEDTEDSSVKTLAPHFTIILKEHAYNHCLCRVDHD